MPEILASQLAEAHAGNNGVDYNLRRVFDVVFQAANFFRIISETSLFYAAGQYVSYVVYANGARDVCFDPLRSKRDTLSSWKISILFYSILF